MRHAKSFSRMLKMHSLMPSLLQKVTEPKQSYMPDYSIDVNKKVKEVLEREQ